MTTHSETKRLPYTPKQMFDLVADVGSYPEFLPWCAAARVRSRVPQGETEVMTADLVISFKVFRERFTSRVVLNEAEGGCEIEFFVDFEFRNRILQSAIGLVFYDAMQRIVRAFERRAAELYR